VKCWVFGANWGDQLTDVISSLIDYVRQLDNVIHHQGARTTGFYLTPSDKTRFGLALTTSTCQSFKIGR
jgi:hypothetical protein